MLRWIWVLLAAGAVGGIPCCAQQSAGTPAAPGEMQRQLPPPMAPHADAQEQKVLRKMAQERNVDRQKELVADADKLLELAKKLKAEVDKSNKNQLSLSVVDTARQIEKLAKTVKQRMRDGT